MWNRTGSLLERYCELQDGFLQLGPPLELSRDRERGVGTEPALAGTAIHRPLGFLLVRAYGPSSQRRLRRVLISLHAVSLQLTASVDLLRPRPNPLGTVS